MGNQTLTEAEIVEFEDFIQTEELIDAHDYYGTHGFIAGLAVSPVEMPDAAWLAILLDVDEESISKPEFTKVGETLIKLKKAIEYSLYHSEKIVLPCPLRLSPKPDESALRSWAIGFMETVFLEEDSWYNVNEETVAQLLLPMILASGLHEEQEILKMERDPKLGQAILLQIPEVIIDLYILYRSGNAPE